MIRTFRALHQSSYSWDVRCCGMSMNVQWEKNYPLLSLNRACYRRGGNFLFLPKCRSLGRWRCFVDCWPLLLSPISLLPVWSLVLFCWWSSMSLSVVGGLDSFRLMISSLVSLILRSRALFSISSSLLMNWISLRCRSFICCIVAFSFCMWRSFSSRNFSSGAVLLFNSSFSFSAPPPSVLFSGCSLWLVVCIEASEVRLGSTCMPASHLRIISMDETGVPVSEVRLSVVVAVSRFVTASLRLLFQKRSYFS